MNRVSYQEILIRYLLDLEILRIEISQKVQLQSPSKTGL